VAVELDEILSIHLLQSIDKVGLASIRLASRRLKDDNETYQAGVQIKEGLKSW